MMSKLTSVVGVIFIMLCFSLLIMPFDMMAQNGEMSITTSSKEALKLFWEGVHKYNDVEMGAAADYFEKAIEKDPDFAMAHVYRAFSGVESKIARQHLDKALGLMDKVSEGEKIYILYAETFSSGDTEKREKYMNQLVERFPDDKYILFRAGAYNKDYKKDYEKALYYFNKVLSIDENYAAVYNRIGLTHVILENYEEAEKALKTYIKLLPESPNPYDSYASFLHKLGRDEEAIEYYKKAFEKDNRYIAALRRAGHLYCLKGDYKTARENYKKYFSTATNSNLKMNGLYWQAVTHIYEDNLDEVLKLFKEYQAIAEQENLSIPRIESHSGLGLIYTELGNPTEGMKYYKQAIDLVDEVQLKESTKEVAVLYTLRWQAMALIAQQKLAKAKEMLKKYDEQDIAAKEDENQKKMINEVRARLAMAEGNYDEALGFLAKVDENNPLNVYFQAVSYEKTGAGEKASELYKKLKDWSDNSIELAFVRNKMSKK